MVHIAAGHPTWGELSGSGEIPRDASWRSTPSAIWKRISEVAEPSRTVYKSTVRRGPSSYPFRDGESYPSCEAHPYRRKQCLRMEFGWGGLLFRPKRLRSRSAPWSLGRRMADGPLRKQMRFLRDLHRGDSSEFGPDISAPLPTRNAAMEGAREILLYKVIDVGRLVPDCVREALADEISATNLTAVQRSGNWCVARLIDFLCNLNRATAVARIRDVVSSVSEGFEVFEGISKRSRDNMTRRTR